MVYEPRTYRKAVDAAGLVSFEVVRAETDLHISASRELSSEAAALVERLRAPLEHYIAAHPHFAESFAPVEVERDAPEIVRSMADAARAVGVGPMAAVAGALAEGVARGLSALSSEVIVENGGDLYLMGAAPRTVLLQAGDSPLSGKVALDLRAEDLPVAICTSSGTVGHSVSLGVADAVTVLADDGALADAAATAVGNLIHCPSDAEAAVAYGRAIPGVRGVVIIAGERIGAAGAIRLVRVSA